MSFTSVRWSLGATLLLAGLTLCARPAHAATPLSSHGSAALTIGATVLRSCAVGINDGLRAFDANHRSALIEASYEALATTCQVDGAHIQLGAVQTQLSIDAAVLDVEL